MTQPASILVAGAGPAGLTLALQARAHGASVRIIDRRPDIFRPSRALILHARTLEVLRPLGVTGALLDRADTAPAADLKLGSRAVSVRFADLAVPDTAFPHLSLIRQMDVESALAEALAERGVEVERGTDLIGVSDGQADVRVLLRSAAGTREARFGYVAGCDGPASLVRHRAGIGWPGARYGAEIVLADAELDADPGAGAGAAHVAVGRAGLVFLFPLGELATWRLLATRPAGTDPLPFGQPGPAVAAGDVQRLLDAAGLGLRITSLAWSAQVRLQHRVADRFSSGRLYLAGDAAHAYSPATGQGMNAAIQDAANLGWKLAFASSRPPADPLLASYDLERRPVARRVLAMTHLAFWAEASTGPLASAVRGTLAPLAAPLLPALTARPRLAAAAFRLLSQLWVDYRRSPLSAERGGRPRRGPRAGDRLPDQAVVSGGRPARLHDLTATPGVHVLLDADAGDIGTSRLGPLVSVHRLDDRPGRGLVAVRPDGYIGLRSAAADPGLLAAWLASIGATG